MGELAGGHGALLARHAGRDDRRRRQAPAAAAGVPGGRRARRPRPTASSARRSRSSSCTRDARPRRRARRLGAAPRAARRSSPRGGRRLATATGDLLFSRAFAELAGRGSIERCGRSREPARELAAGRADAARRRVGRGGVGRALPRALPAEDRRAVPRGCELGALEGGGPVAVARRASASRSASRSRSSTTSSTSPVRRSGPASRAAPTCSTAPSRCR